MYRVSLSILILIVFCSTQAFAQEYVKEEESEDNRPQKIGIRIGLTNSTFKQEGFQNIRSQSGIQGSIYYRMQLNKTFHLMPEMVASFRGANFNNTANDLSYKKIGLFYLDLPLHLMVAVDREKKHHVYFGPMLSHLVRPSLFLSRDVYPTFTNLPFRKWDVGVSFGYHFNTRLVGINVGYRLGLLNISQGNWAEHPTPGTRGNAISNPNGDIYLYEILPDLSGVRNVFNRALEVSLYF